MATDLYRNGITGKLLRPPSIQGAARWLLLLLLVLLVAVAWGRSRLPGIQDAFPLLYTNAATLLFWVVWFMGIVLLAPVVGRVWCGVCPLGLVSEKTGGLGLNLQWPGKAARALTVLTVFLAGIGAVLLFDAHKSPHLTAITVGGAAVLALISGLVWRRSAFCGFLCPVGTVLSLYGRFSPLKVAPLEGGKCAACASRSCMTRTSVWKRWDMGSLVIHKKKWTGGCPVALDPPTMDASECIGCLYCVRNCSEDNLGVFYGRRTSTSPLKTTPLVLLAPLAGLVLLVLVRTWPDARDALAPGAFPAQWLWGLWFGLAIPAAAIFSGAALHRLGEKTASAQVPEPVGETPGRAPKVESKGFFWAAARIAAPFAGPVLGGHMGVALVKLNAKVAYAPYLFYDPTGVTTYMAIYVTKALDLPPMALAMGWVRGLAWTLMAVGIGFGAWDAARLWKAPLGALARVVAWLALVALSALYASLLVHWLWGGGR